MPQEPNEETAMEKRLSNRSRLEDTPKVILLVEDNPDDELLALRALRKNDVPSRIIVVHDGQEALDYLFAEGAYAHRDAGEYPALILLDLKLPKIDGLEVLRRLRSDAKTRLLPIVILTSSDEACDIMESYEFHANSFIRKPVDFNQFLKAMRQLGDYWLMLNITPPLADAS
jgi:two-component system, response regulator